MMPGLAANPSIFEKLLLPDKYSVYWMYWLIPEKDETLSHYVDRLIEDQIFHQNPILIGVSFGGMIIQEIAKKMQVSKLILISTVKNENEFPNYFKWVLRYKLYKLFPSRIMHHIDFLESIAFTKNLKQKMRLYQRYLDVNDPQYLNWAIKTLLQWKQTKTPKNYVHIHGNRDKIFPINRIKQPIIVIDKGRHDMIIRRGSWFYKNIPSILESSALWKN